MHKLPQNVQKSRGFFLKSEYFRVFDGSFRIIFQKSLKVCSINYEKLKSRFHPFRFGRFLLLFCAKRQVSSDSRASSPTRSLLCSPLHTF